MDVNYKLIQDTQVIIVFKYYKFIYTQIICFPPSFLYKWYQCELSNKPVCLSKVMDDQENQGKDNRQ